MLWTPQQQQTIDTFLQEIKNIGWLAHTGEPSRKYWVVDTVWEACDTHGRATREVWGRNCEEIERRALLHLTEEQVDAIFTAVSLAIGNEVYAAVCDMADRIGEETGEDQSGIEEEILDFIKRDTAWACIERLLPPLSGKEGGTTQNPRPGFFSRVHAVNRMGRWACSWVGKYPEGGFIIM